MELTLDVPTLFTPWLFSQDVPASILASVSSIQTLSLAPSFTAYVIKTQLLHQASEDITLLQTFGLVPSLPGLHNPLFVQPIILHIL